MQHTHTRVTVFLHLQEVQLQNGLMLKPGFNADLGRKTPEDRQVVLCRYVASHSRSQSYFRLMQNLFFPAA